MNDTIQLSYTDRQAIDKAISECLGFIPENLTDIDRLDYLDDEDCVYEKATKYGFKF